jgi:hypothetical protein
MKDVYTVTHGEDEEFTFDGVFESREIARKYIDQYVSESMWYKAEDFKIERWPLNCGIDRDTFTFFVNIYEDGHAAASMQACPELVGTFRKVLPTKGMNIVWQSVVRAKNRQEAERIAVDMIEKVEQSVALYPFMEKRCAYVPSISTYIYPWYNAETHSIIVDEEQEITVEVWEK